MNLLPTIMVPAGLILAPLLPGLINRTKAVFAGRRGAPLLQPYHDIFKLLRKGAVYSSTTTWVFRAAPAVGLASMAAALTLLPVFGIAAPMRFAGDFVLFAYCLALARFFMVIAALDTGSAFEGMGASREVHFSALAEPALIIGLAALARLTDATSLSDIYPRIQGAAWLTAGPAIVLVSAALAIVFLCENARIPVDDPNTHLELTMIHEVMVLDYSGPDLAMILYSASLKLWILGALIVNMFLSLIRPGAGAAGFALGMIVLAIAVGTLESIMARMSLLKVPRLLVGASALAALSFVLIARITS